LFCRKGETGITDIPAKNYDEHLLRRPGCRRPGCHSHTLIAMFFSYDHLHNLATEPLLYKVDARR